MSISKLLVANRGEIAARVLRTARAQGLATAVLRHTFEQEGPAHLIADEVVTIEGQQILLVKQLHRHLLVHVEIICVNKLCCIGSAETRHLNGGIPPLAELRDHAKISSNFLPTPEIVLC